jgi:hypothetical protein
MILSMDLELPPEVSERSLELHLNDAFKNVQDVTITGSGQRSKPRVFTWIFHTMTPFQQHVHLINPADHLRRKEEATLSPLVHHETP